MRILHTMVRVENLEVSKEFYTKVLGMKILKEKEYPSGEFTLCFVGYGPIESTAVIELTYNWDNRKYEVGTGYGHVAISTDDLYGMCDRVKELGGKVTREPGPMKGSTSEIAFVEDPDGYKIELIQKK